MGEANLRYARNEKQDAINLCMEVIRQVILGFKPKYVELLSSFKYLGTKLC